MDNDFSKTKKQNITLKKLSSIFGGILVFLSLTYIANYLWAERTKLLDWQFSITSLLLIAGGVLLYATVNLALSSSWVLLLNCFGSKKVDVRALKSIYATSQIAKYIPGNVAHVAGRHAMGRQLGISHIVLMSAAVYEVLGLGAASLGLGLLGSAVMSTEWPLPIPPLMLSISFLFLLVVYFFGVLFYSTWGSKFNGGLSLQRLDYKKTTIILLRALAQYFLFFIVSGFILLGIAYGFVDAVPAESVGLILIAFAISWVIGFITPGAPSGIGVREAIIVYMLQAAITPSVALMVAVIFRITTVLGDVVFLSADYLHKKKVASLI